jgi:hypothetical protein
VSENAPERENPPVRRRGRPPGQPLSAAELEARRRNLEQARAAPKEVIYRPTPERMAASLANLRKAQAARRSEAGSERVRLNALKHGVYSQELVDASARRLGESERALAEHRELFARLFVPRDEQEATVVWELANVAWRRLRLFRAAALREAHDLRRLMEEFPEPAPLDAAETEWRASLLFAALDNCDRVLRDAARLRYEMQQMISLLRVSRTHGKEKQGVGSGESWVGAGKIVTSDE